MGTPTVNPGRPTLGSVLCWRPQRRASIRYLRSRPGFTSERVELHGEPVVVVVGFTVNDAADDLWVLAGDGSVGYAMSGWFTW